MKDLAFFVFFMLALKPGFAQYEAGSFPLIVEAEKHVAKYGAGEKPGGCIWASGGTLTPAFWGRDAGDEIRFSLALPYDEKNLKLAVRYSYAQGHYSNFTGQHNPERNLELKIDEKITVPITVPDTGWWDHFKTSHVTLPPLEKGTHAFRLLSVTPHTTTNVDCFIFYKDSASDLSPALKSTIVAVSDSQRFVLLLTPNADPGMSFNRIFTEFDRIYEHYRDYMGWAPPTPIQIHVIEDACWDNPGATAYQNQWGVYFKAGSMATDQGNWCHEMTHMFYCAHFPSWFDESSVRMLTTFNWVPDLFPAFKNPEDNPYYKQCANEGSRILANPQLKVDHVEPIQYAIRLKYGKDAFRKFFHLCHEAGEKGELDFKPGRHLTNEEIVLYMSKAVGEDVRPLYKQWKGF